MENEFRRGAKTKTIPELRYAGQPAHLGETGHGAFPGFGPPIQLFALCQTRIGSTPAPEGDSELRNPSLRPIVAGNPDTAFAGAARTIEAEYEIPVQGHTAFGPAHATGPAANAAREIATPEQAPEMNFGAGG